MKIKMIFWGLLVSANAWGMESNKETKKELASEAIKKEYNPRYQEWLTGTRQKHSAERLSFYISCFLFRDLHKLLHENATEKSVAVLIDQVAMNPRMPIDSKSITFENELKLPLQEVERQIKLINLKIQQLQALHPEMALEMAKKSKL